MDCLSEENMIRMKLEGLKFEKLDFDIPNRNLYVFHDGDPMQINNALTAHMKASMIFTSNDVIVNLGVIVAGILVYFTNSKYPDLVVGSVVFFLVAKGAFKILKLAK
jgi:Co/Zn/Cd efflux system component